MGAEMLVKNKDYFFTSCGARFGVPSQNVLLLVKGRSESGIGFICSKKVLRVNELFLDH